MNITRRRLWIAVATAVLCVCALAAGIYWQQRSSGDAETDAATLPGGQVEGAVPQLPETTLMPVAPEEALAMNEKLPFSKLPIEPAWPMTMDISAAPPGSYLNAVNCLTAAIYYEGATEPLQGRRAIAQVIINRARHPAFPNSICGVVYQGSERRTGCQFTFTCDGSLQRRPSRSGWDQARSIALAALAGLTEPGVGMATHYHADYVVPYWASSLEKISKIGAHIFYRWRGNWGRPAAFSQRVAAEPELTDGLEASLFADPLQIEMPGDEIMAPHVPPVDMTKNTLQSDRDSGQLKLDSAPGAMEKDANITTPTMPKLEADRAAGRLRVDEVPENRLPE